MILYIDWATNIIIGYGEQLQEKECIPNNVHISDEDFSNLNIDKLTDGKYSYINGNVVEIDQSIPDAVIKKNELLEELASVNRLISDEQKIFMDNIVSGMTVEDATAICKENRVRRDSVSAAIESINDEIQSKRQILGRYYQKNYSAFVSWSNSI